MALSNGGIGKETHALGSVQFGEEDIVENLGRRFYLGKA
jgi:hypothetical protein